MAIQIQLRRGTAAQWTSSNPTLALGEMALETDTDQIKIGDGVTAWAGLAYGGIQGPTGPTGATGATGPQGDTGATGPGIEGVTATATELNFVDGVTSGIQGQLDAKVDEVNGAVTTASTSLSVVRNITFSTSDPTGGLDGDVWLKYTA